MMLRIGNFVMPTRGLKTVIGAIFILFSLAIDFSFANLNTYVISYMRNKDPSITYADWVLVSQAKTFTIGLLMSVMGGTLETKIGPKKCILLGSIIYTGCITMTYFSIDYGIYAVVLTLSVSHGIGFSLMYAQSIGSVIKWFIGNRKGFMSSLAIGAYGFGAAIWIPIETTFVNPNNVAAVEIANSTEIVGDRYFEDPDVLNRVPQLFLLLGGIFATLQIIGLLFIQEAKDETTQESAPLLGQRSTPSSNIDQNLERGNLDGTPISLKLAWPSDELSYAHLCPVEDKKQAKDNIAMRIETSQNVDPKKIPVDSNGMELPNLTALETVSQSKFWLLWTIFVAISIMSGFVNNYQKTFGMKFITDDFFFTYVGFASNLINGSSRIMWGYLHDLKGFKFSALIIGFVTTGLTISSLLLYVIPETYYKAFYALWVCLFYVFFSGIYSIMAPVIQTTFGQLNYSRDFGLVFTQSLVASVFITLSTKFLFNSIGYYGLFPLCAFIGLIGIAATIKFKPTTSSASRRNSYEEI